MSGDDTRPDSISFNENYKILKETADWLSDQAEPDIDQLVPKVEQAMQAYQNAAIALDPFPFSGCSTTCDALWMGLPVVTWPRATIASRQSAAWLEMAGRADWVVRGAESYVAKALELARDEAGRRQWRMTARQRLRPALCDSRRLAAELMDALRTVAPESRRTGPAWPQNR